MDEIQKIKEQLLDIDIKFATDLAESAKKTRETIEQIYLDSNENNEIKEEFEEVKTNLLKLEKENKALAKILTIKKQENEAATN